jgi:hypothetical protein
MPACGVSIAVNRAAVRFACDWWVALDFQTLLRELPVGNPQLLTRQAYRPKYADRSGIDIESLCAPDSNLFGQFSATAALVLSHHLGAGSIDVYGADWTAEADFDGCTPAGSCRDESRWLNERRIWDAICKWLHVRNVSVKRYVDI